MPNYVKIPKEITYDTTLTDKRVIIFSYLCARRALDDTVAFSTTELCHWSKLKPNYRAGKINQKYYTTLSFLADQNYFLEHPDFQSLLQENSNSTKFHLLKLNIEKFDVPDHFGLIYFDELEKILNFKEELEFSGLDTNRMSSAYLLLVLAYLRTNMNRISGKPYCCYRFYSTISEETGLSERYIGRIVDILDVLEIVKSVALPRELYIDRNGKERFATTPKVFADYRHFVKDTNGNQRLDSEYDYKIEIEKQIKEMKNMYK